MQKNLTPPQPAPAFDLEAFRLTDPEAFMRNMMQFMEQGTKVMTSYAEKAGLSANPMAQAGEAADAGKLVTNVATAWLGDPAKVAESQTELLRGFVELWSGNMRRLAGQTPAPIATPEPGDNRFKHPDWNANPYFDFWKQTYLFTSQWAEGVLDRTQGLDEHTRRRAQFMMRQITTALSPTNFAATNPEVLREAFLSNGQSLVRGMENLAKDLAKSGTTLRISQVDTDAFEIGRNVATTPGKVIFQNDVLQLIQYTPITEKVHEVPFLIVPPWINKFYILDLTAERSFIRFALDQGFTVFIVSWVNPDERHRTKTWEDYMRQGILDATGAVQREAGVPKINILGYCIGGTLLGTTLAHLAQRGEQPYHSVTFLAAQVDFSDAGDLSVFIDEEQLANVDKMIDQKGYLDGASMATVFNMLRPRDLIWNYVVNNYMLGKKPMAFDLLYWNQDSTRLPGANHKYYLREFYLHNKLAKGELKIAGAKLDLGRVEVPIYEIAAKEDHIAPARSVFLGAKLFGGPVTYVLGGSGHIAGVINPPGKPKYQYWTNPRPLSHPDCATFDSWHAGASETAGSWWPHWAKWLAKHSGAMVAPRVPGAKLGVIEDAPGSYVKAKA